MVNNCWSESSFHVPVCVLCSCRSVHACVGAVVLCDKRHVCLRTRAHTPACTVQIHTSLFQYTHTEAVLSCSYCTEITCKHLGYVHKAGTRVAISRQPSPSLLLSSNTPFLAWREGRGSASGKGYRMTGILHSSRRLHISLYTLIYFLCSCNSSFKQDTTLRCSQYCFIIIITIKIILIMIVIRFIFIVSIEKKSAHENWNGNHIQ